MKNEEVDFLKWLHKEREIMERERKERHLSDEEWSKEILEDVQKKGFVVSKPQKSLKAWG